MKYIICIVLSATITHFTSGQELKSNNLSDFIGKLYAEGKIHGGILVAEGNNILYKDGWGIAKKSTKHGA
ncbi:MAG: hypothetical protein ACFB2Y_23165 [Fulvivirga sp.]